jgi:hypothetical protein
MLPSKRAIFFKDEWQVVDVPNAAFSWLPFEIEQKNGVFRPRGFDLQSHANITVSKTYYVDRENGNDGNTGADWDNALKTLNTAWAKADVDRVYVRDSVFYLSECNTEPTRSVETIGIGTVKLTSNVFNNAGAWSAVDSHYEAVVGSGRYVYSVYDHAWLDEYGLPRPLTKKTSVEDVDANAGSYYYDYTYPNSDTYIRTYDDREPDGDIWLHESGPFYRSADSQVLYFENLEFCTGVTIRNASATGGMKAYLKDCTLGSMTIRGADEIILQNCTCQKGKYADGDLVNIDVLNGVISKVIEIDCTMRYTEADSNQTSTGHNACVIVRIGGEYAHTSAQIIADASGCYTWMLGCNLHDSAAGVGFYSGGYAWLDGCTIGEMAFYVIHEGGAGAVYYRDLISGGNFEGTVEPY